MATAMEIAYKLLRSFHLWNLSEILERKRLFADHSDAHSPVGAVVSTPLRAADASFRSNLLTARSWREKYSLQGFVT